MNYGRRKKRSVVPLVAALTVAAAGIVLWAVFKSEGRLADSPSPTASITAPSSVKNEFMDCDYYLENRSGRYAAYREKHPDITAREVVEAVNSNLDSDFYELQIKTDTGTDTLLLVNKYYYLSNEYEPDDLVTLSDKYNKGSNDRLRQVAADAFIRLCDAAAADGISIKNASAYRSYAYQATLYNKYVEEDGQAVADTYSAHAGSSEHQTGLALDVNTINSSFAQTREFAWMQENSYKYGFILRYPEDKTEITGYKYEPWHYRYVGEDAAGYIYEHGITFEEYYACFVEK